MTMIRKGYVDIRAGQIHCRSRSGLGTPVLFLHQTASSSAMWERVMACWPGSQPLYAIDTPGFGGSFDPPDDLNFGMDDYVGWTLAAVEALGLGRVHLVGHHTGAAIGLAVANSAPIQVASLSMIGPAYLSADERRAFSSRLGPAFRPGRSGAYLLKNWEYLRVGGADRDIDLLHREMIDMLRAWRARPHAYGAVWAQDFESLFLSLECPALLMAAKDDILFPYLGRARVARPDIPVIELNTGANYEPDLASEAVATALAEHISQWDLAT